MGSSIWVTLERPVPGVDPLATGGKALARELERLDALATELGVRPFSSFFSFPPAELAAMAEDFGFEPPAALPAEQWFPATEGLSTLRTLGELLQGSDEAHLRAELAELEHVLVAADGAGVAFHLSIDA